MQRGLQGSMRAGRALVGWKSIQPCADGRTLSPIMQLVGAKPFIGSTYVYIAVPGTKVTTVNETEKAAVLVELLPVEGDRR